MHPCSICAGSLRLLSIRGKDPHVNILDQLLPQAGSFYVNRAAFSSDVFQRIAFFTAKKGVQLDECLIRPTPAPA